MSANGVVGQHGMERGWAVAAPTPDSSGAASFGDVLRALNPLQYVPVVGTIYRLATGDEAPSGLRAGVSVVIGAVTGGPVGIAASVIGAIADHFLHLEDLLRRIVEPGASQPPAPPRPALESGQDQPVSTTAPAAAYAAAAYRSAGLLGSV